jgi:hypothetical protein
VVYEVRHCVCQWATSATSTTWRQVAPRRAAVEDLRETPLAMAGGRSARRRALHAKQPRSTSIVCSTSPNSRTRTQRFAGTSTYHTAPSESRQMPSGKASPRSAQTRRFDRLPSAAMSKAVSPCAYVSARMSGKRDFRGDLSHFAVWPHQYDGTRSELAARKLETKIADVCVAATVHPPARPTDGAKEVERSACTASEPSGSRRRSLPSRTDTMSNWPFGRKPIPIGMLGVRVIKSWLPCRSTAPTSCAPKFTNQRRPSCQRGDSPKTSPVIKIRRSSGVIAACDIVNNPLGPGIPDGFIEYVRTGNVPSAFGSTCSSCAAAALNRRFGRIRRRTQTTDRRRG